MSDHVSRDFLYDRPLPFFVPPELSAYWLPPGPSDGFQPLGPLGALVGGKLRAGCCVGMIRRGGGGGGRRTIGLGKRGASGKSTSWLTAVADGMVGRET